MKNGYAVGWLIKTANAIYVKKDHYAIIDNVIKPKIA